jgi:hypothetical protein
VDPYDFHAKIVCVSSCYVKLNVVAKVMVAVEMEVEGPVQSIAV